MICVDINIFVDVLTAREGYDTSARVIDLVEKGKENGVISALTIPILWYLTARSLNNDIAKIKVKEIIKGFVIQNLDKPILDESFSSDIKDFEDSIQYFSAKRANCVIIITRNVKDFKDPDDMKIYTPEEYLKKEGKIK